jgi:Fe(3+) dicitrate transport protein
MRLSLIKDKKNMKRNKNKRSRCAWMGRTVIAGLALQGLATAQDPAENEPQVSQSLDALVIVGESESDRAIQDLWLPAVSGAQIYSGKKTQVIDLDDMPRNVGNNYRQALIKSPSLLLSEESSPLVSIGYRGLNPHRAQFTQMLRDGLPIHADQFGYPEAYYTPPLDTVDRIEFLHGGAALQFGPQPGGSLNYITHRPRTDKEFSFRTQQVVGSDDLYTNFTSADGTVGKLGYYAYFNHRESDGFRTANSAYDLDTGSVKLLYSLDNGGKLVFTADTYEETHGEPGGLTRANFFAGDLTATRLFDNMTIERDSVTLTYEIEPTSDSFFTSSVWISDYLRYSARQRGGGFGTVPAGPASTTNSIERQEFHTLGWDTRYRQNWGSEYQHTFSTGVQFYYTDSPRYDYRGVTPDASTGALRNHTEREIFYAPIFAENRFKFGNLSVTPGVRIENSWQDVREIVNVDKTALLQPLGSKDDHATVILGGLGIEYELPRNTALYGNVSQSYRPMIFTEAVPTGGGTVVNNDLEEGKSIEYELGVKSKPNEWLNLDASVFLLQFTDQIGVVAPTLQNVGDSQHLGIDFYAGVDFLALLEGEKTDQALEWFVSATFLEAEFVDGLVDGNTPQYAPDHTIRSGLVYRNEERGTISLSSTYVDDYYADDGNTANFQVPNYNVWDLTAEIKVHKNVSLIAGINNLFDQQYFTRVRNDGIDPSNGRNYYVGFSLDF